MQNEDGTDSIVSIQYYDVAGRATETVANPFKGKFLHALNTYDPMGRVSRTWLPVATASEDVLTEDSFNSLSAQQYADPMAYTSSRYDALDRPVFSSTPGSAWAGKGKTVEYGTNPDSLVKHYDVTELRYHLGEQDFEYYPKGTLSYTKAITEDGQTMTTYTDFSGNVVLERRGTDNDTYYVYDNRGLLCYVLQPMYQECPDLALYAFCYDYNLEGQVYSMKLPGCDPVLYEYDAFGRVKKMQDGVLRTRGKYRVYTYDALGRLTNQSISDGDRVEYDEIVNFYDTYDYLKNPQYADMVPANNVDTTSLCPFHPKNGYGQLTGTWQRASNGEDMLMSYNYDDYGRLTMTKEIGLDKHLSVVYQDYNFNGAILSEHRDLYRYDKMENALNDNTLYGSIKHYFTASNNKRPYRSVIRLTHKGSTSQTKDEIMKPTYDDFGRMIANDRKGTAGDMTYSYDKLHGWLTQIGSSSGFRQTLYRENSKTGKRYDGSIASMSWEVGDGSVHTYHYAYDGMNRLTEAVYSSNRDIYDKLRPSTNPVQAAGLSELNGKEPLRLIPMERLQGNYSESYSYDKNCNLTWLQRTGTSNSVKGKVIDLLECGYSGNQLKSVADYSDEDLNYAGAFDFQNKADDVDEYSYNENGAMTKDLNKGITNIEYDLLGNPQKVTFGSRTSIEYVYAADGRKLRAVHSSALRIRVVPSGNKGKLPGYTYKYLRDTTDYINNYVFKNGKPEMFRFNGGYYSFDEEGNMDGCHFYVQDYQGNNRMVVNAYTDEVEQINHYYPYGVLMADISTNPDKQKYKYGEKELDRAYGLDLYDFEARRQDPIIGGRFTSVDPMAGDYNWLSPYAYCAGDPINLVDPTGMDVWMLDLVTGDVTRYAYDGMDVVCYTKGGVIVTKSYFEKGTIDGHEGKNGGYVFFFDDNVKAKEVFETTADNSDVEWSRIEAENRNDGSVVNIVATSRQTHKESSGKKAVSLRDYFFSLWVHSHPSGNPTPSGIFPQDTHGDIFVAKENDALLPAGMSCYYAVYVPSGRVFQGVDCHSLSKNKGYYRYTSNTTVSSFFESFGIRPHK